MRGAGLIRRLRSGRSAPYADLLPDLDDEDRRYLSSLHDETTPLPDGADRELSASSPRLAELRDAYRRSELPALDASRWSEEAVNASLDLRYFRGETLITWHYRELPRITKLKYFLYLRYVEGLDEVGALNRLTEDGAFGCWTFGYPGYGRISRDLLESVNEISFLERELHMSEREQFSVLDIGAGYGRLAHRMTETYPQLVDYCCVDAIPESTFICEYYLRHRGCERARSVALDQVESALRPGSFDLAVNIHSFPETTFRSVEWWLELLGRLEVPYLLVIPNEPTDLLTLETDGSRRDFAPLVERAGYELLRREPIIADPAVRELLELEDQFHLFARTASR
jgi:SAM-dependent methyltransferase